MMTAATFLPFSPGQKLIFSPNLSDLDKQVTAYLPAKGLNMLVGTAQAGLDSLGAVELRNAVSSHFGVVCPATMAFDYPTAAALAAFVTSHVMTSQPEDVTLVQVRHLSCATHRGLLLTKLMLVILKARTTLCQGAIVSDEVLMSALNPFDSEFWLPKDEHINTENT